MMKRSRSAIEVGDPERSSTKRDLQVAEDAGHDEGGRVEELGGPQPLHHRGVGRVDEIGDQQAGQGHHDGRIEKGLVVAGEAGAVAGGEVAGDIVAPFGEGQEQRQEARGDHDPGAGLDADDPAPALDPEHEASGHDHDVEDGDALEAQRVGEIEGEVQRRDDEEAPAEDDREAAAGEEERHQQHEGVADAEGAGGERAMALLRMEAIRLAVGIVVQDIDGAGQQAEADHRQTHPPEIARAQRRRGEEEGCRDEGVLDPVLGSENGEDGLTCGQSDARVCGVAGGYRRAGRQSSPSRAIAIRDRMTRPLSVPGA